MPSAGHGEVHARAAVDVPPFSGAGNGVSVAISPLESGGAHEGLEGPPPEPLVGMEPPTALTILKRSGLPFCRGHCLLSLLPLNERRVRRVATPYTALGAGYAPLAAEGVFRTTLSRRTPALCQCLAVTYGDLEPSGGMPAESPSPT